MLVIYDNEIWECPGITPEILRSEILEQSDLELFIYQGDKQKQVLAKELKIW